MLHIGVGTALIIIGLTAQCLIKKRVKHPKVARAFAWIAWIFAALGGEAITGSVGNTIGISAAGAAVVSIVMLLVLVCDIADKRPDWPAFIIVCTVPFFMRLVGGPLGGIFDAILSLPHALNQGVAGFMGM